MLLIFKKHKMVIVDGMKDFRDVCCYWKIINYQHFHFAPCWRLFIFLPFRFYSLRKQLNNREIDSSRICLICQISFCECILNVLWWVQNLEKIIWIKINMSNRILPENTTHTKLFSLSYFSQRRVLNKAEWRWGVYRVLGRFPGLHFADVLHVLELPELGQGVMTEGLMQRRVSVLVLYVQLGLGSHQQLRRPTEDFS